MKNTMEDLQERLEQARRDVEEAERAMADRNALTEEQRLAIDLHELLCTANHVDQCGWDYEHGDRMWDNGTHALYLERAKGTLAVVDAETALKVLRVTRRY